MWLVWLWKLFMCIKNNIFFQFRYVATWRYHCIWTHGWFIWVVHSHSGGSRTSEICYRLVSVRYYYQILSRHDVQIINCCFPNVQYHDSKIGHFQKFVPGSNWYDYYVLSLSNLHICYYLSGSSHIIPASAEEVARVIAMTQQNVASKTKPQDMQVGNFPTKWSQPSYSLIHGQMTIDFSKACWFHLFIWNMTVA